MFVLSVMYIFSVYNRTTPVKMSPSSTFGGVIFSLLVPCTALGFMGCSGVVLFVRNYGDWLNYVYIPPLEALFYVINNLCAAG